MARLALLLSLAISTAAACSGGKACIQVYNKCPFTIWPGVQGSVLIAGGGFRLDGGQSKWLEVPDGWSAGRIWARTGCDGNFNCESGFCGNKEQCGGNGGEPPVSLAEFTLHGSGNQDFYDVSLVDGYNLPVFIQPVDNTFNTNGGEYDCKRAGGCVQDLNDPNICPSELRNVKNGKIVGCKSACLALNTDQYCCRGAYGQPQNCNPASWPRNYAKIFKASSDCLADACPAAYSYAYDDKTSTFFCRGRGTPSPDYVVQFC